MTTMADSGSPRNLILLNPHAGGGRAGRLYAPLAKALANIPRGDGVAVPHFTLTDSEATALACIDALPRNSRVVVVGGDGTLNRLMPALLRGGHTLGLVPAGSGNDTARALGLRGMPYEAALRLALGAEATPIDVGEARFELPQGPQVVPFLSSLTAGFDSAVGLRAIKGPRWLRGLPRYLLATFGELAALRNWPLQVTTDGELIHNGPALFASSLNTPTFAGGMPAVPHARNDDSGLDLLLAGPFGLAGTLCMLPLLLAGRHLGRAKVHTRAFHEMVISSTQPVPLAADGEYLGEARQVTVKVLPGALRVVRAAAALCSPPCTRTISD
jgi:diacylglycerol kinase family enzyme